MNIVSSFTEAFRSRWVARCGQHAAHGSDHSPEYAKRSSDRKVEHRVSRGGAEVRDFVRRRTLTRAQRGGRVLNQGSIANVAAELLPCGPDVAARQWGLLR